MTIVTKDFPNKSFSSREELFAELRKEANKIIELKKAEVHKSEGEGFCTFLEKENTATKAGDINMKEDYVYPIINTTKYMDSHRDVHFDGIWNKSVKEQNGKIFYVTDHELKVDHIIAWPNDVNVMVKSVPWAFVGKNYDGETEALIYEIPKNKIVHEKAKDIIEEKKPVQNSVRMIYVKLRLGMDSSAKEDIEYKKYYDSRINEIANRDAVKELGYFWGVEEAKIFKEGSMVILGSNDATPIQQKDNEPDEASTHDTNKEPVKTTQDFDWDDVIKNTNFIKI